MHTVEATDRLLRDYASAPQATLDGEVLETFLNLVEERMGATPAVSSFLQGLERTATV
ncbi:hypothetical protein ACQPZ2_19125 [Nocardia pseudovaccinii]|uniref:hypothetical protein n=1 Tax=Nocardia pseudovaccinii TaxID=189540 RepID=UPI003D8E77B3